MSEKTILVWFRNDLRIHDNEILVEAIRKADKVLPVFIFDPFYFKTTRYGTLKTGNFRAKFLIESVQNLRDTLHSLGGELIVRNVTSPTLTMTGSGLATLRAIALTRANKISRMKGFTR